MRRALMPRDRRCWNARRRPSLSPIEFATARVRGARIIALARLHYSRARAPAIASATLAESSPEQRCAPTFALGHCSCVRTPHRAAPSCESTCTERSPATSPESPDALRCSRAARHCSRCASSRSRSRSRAPCPDHAEALRVELTVQGLDASVGERAASGDGDDMFATRSGSRRPR